MFFIKLTNATEQALAIVAILSTQVEDIPASSIAIYQKLAVSPSYIKKLLRKLVVAQVIKGVSGTKGGFYLSRDLRDISLLEIIEAIEGRLDSYPNIGVLNRTFSDHEELADHGNVQITRIFEKADEAWSKVLRETSAHDVLLEVFSSNDQILKGNWNNVVCKEGLANEEV